MDAMSERAVDWATTTIGGDWTFLRTRPWAAVWRADTADGTWWLKVNSPGTGYEPRLLDTLATLDSPVLPRSIVHPDEPWALIADAGRSARDTLAEADVDRRIDFWIGVVTAYAGLQQAAAGLDLLGAGVPDYRPESLVDRFDEVVADRRWLDPAVAVGLDPTELGRVPEARSRLVAAAAALADSMPSTVEHGDLHDANVFVRDGRTLIIDWGDTAYAHPFHTLLITLDVLAAQLDCTADDPRLRRVADAYLECWRIGGESTAALREQLDLARRTGALARAGSWRRALDRPGLAPEADSDDAVAYWLLRLVHALDR